MRCPVCRADNAVSVDAADLDADSAAACRRCKADLVLMASLERQRRALLTECRTWLAKGDAPQALRAAARAHQIRPAADTARLLAVGHLHARHFALALRWHRAALDFFSAESAAMS
ncbi:MAG: hypothetical protein L0Y71_15895 [Gemmataceae bacterium]|nr:hypothetical protein [Gemmataceae bacterium]